MIDRKDYLFELTDETLVGLTLLGDTDAFEELVMRYQKAVASAAYAVIRDYHLAQDVMQNAFVTAWIKLNTLREPGKFGVWVRNIARNDAKNTVRKYRDYICLDSLDSLEGVAAKSAGNDDYDPLYEAVEKLSDKLKSVVKLYYFDDVSIEEISIKLNLPAGTVKWRLHEGRTRIRKELGYMESNTAQTAKSILEKIKEFRIRWITREGKEDFEADYKHLMAEIEKMPDSEEKFFNMANVMAYGNWYLTDENKNEFIEKLREAAEKGKNLNVLGDIWKREAEKYQGDEKTEFILKTLIPRMEQANMTDALGWEWFWLGYEYYKQGNREAGYDAYNKVLNILPKHHMYYANAISALHIEKLAENVDEQVLCAGATGEELLIDNGKLYFYRQPGYSKGSQSHYSIPAVFYYASRCDRTFYDSSLKAGESIKSYDGSSTLSFASDNAEIETSCGVFTGCEHWVTNTPGENYSVYYKRGVGIVHISIFRTGWEYAKSCCSLKKYNIVGGDGLIPFCEGNRWEYETDFSTNAEAVYEVVSFDGSAVIITAYNFGIKTYSPDVWEDMILQMRYGYYKHEPESKLNDVTFQMERAAALADTKYKKTYTAVVTDVMKRIFEGDENYTPDGKFKGHWNFFQYHDVIFDEGKIKLVEDRNFAFEWKNGRGTGDMSYHLAVNYFMSILDSATDCIWFDDWKPGARMTMKGNSFYKPVTDVIVEHLDSAEVAAGRFEDCLKLSLNIDGTDGAGWNNFLKGKKEYYFAKGIGLIKGVHYFKDDTIIPVYELTAYEGTGDGYMPVQDGIYRCYEAMGLTDGYVGKAEYTFCGDDNGQLKLLESNTGIKMK